jgi:predicted nucleotide-binding protein
MARGSSRRPPAPPQPARLSPADMKAGSTRLRQRIADLQALPIGKLTAGDDPAVSELQSRVESTVAQVFGPGSHEYSRLSMAWHLDTTAYTVSLDWGGGPSSGPHIGEIREGVKKGVDRATALLKSAADTLDEALQYSQPQPSAAFEVELQPLSREIFIVHGHDSPAKTEVARLIERAGLRAVILHEQPNSGRTIVEKFEAHGGSAGFAVIILTPDDVGGPVGSASEQLRPRARQNVIGEMFWFAGRLGRSKVCALKKGDTELPSDFLGVTYTEMDDRGAWRAELLRELASAGFDVNWPAALGAGGA